MENIPGNQPQPNTEPSRTTPAKPNEEQNVSPQSPDTEVNPGKVGNNTEVDLDTDKTKTYPPERH